jgi:hypothetical protein
MLPTVGPKTCVTFFIILPCSSINLSHQCHSLRMSLLLLLLLLFYVDVVGRLRTRRCHQHVSRKGGSGSVFLNRNGLDV